MAMTKEEIEQEIIHLLIKIHCSDDDIEVEQLTKSFIETLAKVAHDNTSPTTLDLDGGNGEVNGMKILAELVYDYL